MTERPDYAQLFRLDGRRAVVVGAGSGIGRESALALAAHGAQVVCADRDLVGVLEKRLKKLFAAIMLNTKVVKVMEDGAGIRVTFEGDVADKEQLFDRVLVAVGRRPNSKIPGLETTAVKVDGRGFIETDPQRRTAERNIFAIGDVAGPPLLAHKAMAEGVVAAEHLAGHTPKPLERTNIPNCTYCSPQVASVGLTESHARESGREVKVGKFPFRASGRALAMAETEGFVKIIADAQFGEILGVHIVGPEATEMIAEVTVLKTLEATLEELFLTAHARPTLAEALLEAALAAEGRAIHL